MQLKHGDIWRAIDRLAERHGFSPSGLARKAGLSSTVFNASKRASATRNRWPSTESIAHILRATGTNLEEFVALASPGGDMPRGTLPMTGMDKAQKADAFDDEGHPSGKVWEDISFPAIADPHAFALEISGKNMEPAYREGDRLIISPAEKPRRGDRVVLRTKKGDVMIGQLGRETARVVELISFSSDFTTIATPSREVDWVYRVVWASQ